MVTELWEFMIIINFFLWKARPKSRYATLKQLEKEESAEALTSNLRSSQPSDSLSCCRQRPVLEAQVIVMWREFHEVKLNLYFKFIK